MAGEVSKVFDLDFGRSIKAKVLGVAVELIKRQKRVLISDTTLRDGEQAPQASLNIEQKLTIARQLDALGVDSIEAGFPAASRKDFEAVRLISGKIRRPVISALSRCRKEDIDLHFEQNGPLVKFAVPEVKVYAIAAVQMH